MITAPISGSILMMGALQFITDAWPIFLSLFGLVIWAVRLEGRVNQNDDKQDVSDKRIEALSMKHDLLDSKVVEQLASVRESLARIEGVLGVGKDHRLG